MPRKCPVRQFLSAKALQPTVEGDILTIKVDVAEGGW
jgi:hypothetical protein